jgi:tetratricopeptide (TPR) repeat protein
MTATLLLLLAHATATPGVDERDIRQGRFRAALPLLFRALDAAPADPQVNGQIGVVMAQGGLMASASEYLSVSHGSPAWERQGIQCLSDALSAQGHGDDAWALRQQVMGAERADSAEMLTLNLGAQDLLSVGDHAGAYDLSLQAMAVAPNSAMTLATHALVLMELGELDEAAAFVWQAQQAGSQSVVVRRADARLALLQGEPEAAELSLEGGVGVSRIRHVVHLKAEAYRVQGRPYDALAVLERPRVAMVQQPALLAMRAVLLRELDYDLEAIMACQELTTLFPDSPYTVEALAQLGDDACR